MFFLFSSFMSTVCFFHLFPMFFPFVPILVFVLFWCQFVFLLVWRLLGPAIFQVGFLAGYVGRLAYFFWVGSCLLKEAVLV